MATWTYRGLIEGFYGPPWSWEARAEVMRFGHERGLREYVYAPKDDPLHRARWRDLYPNEVLDSFASLVAEGTLRVGYAIGPGLSMDFSSADDRAALHRKVDQVVGAGIDLVCLAFDDVEIAPGLGPQHAAVTLALHEHLAGRAQLLLVPTDYTGTASTPYLDALAAVVPEDVPIGWTGRAVVNDVITVADAVARAESLGGRAPFLWDNYPVNDAVMADQLFLGPLRGREPGLAEVCSGYAANPTVQPHAALPALGSIAAYLRGDDPADGWAEAVDALDLRVIAEACDGVHPNALVDAVIADPDDLDALDRLDAWLRAARHHDGGILAGEAQPWIDQVHAEAGVGRLATRVRRAIRGADGRGPTAEELAQASHHALGLMGLWPALARNPVAVMGPRRSFRPVIEQWPDGSWRYRAAALTEGANAIDRLVRDTLTALDAAAPRSS